MSLTCAQMDVLISFYIDGDLSNSLKSQVEEHIKLCPTCRAKFDIIKSMLLELKNNVKVEEKAPQNKNFADLASQQYRIFKSNLSAYVDNELSEDDSLKMKKFAINNKSARRDLENTYSLRRMMNESFKKSKTESKRDFSKHVLRQLELEDQVNLGVHPAIKLLIFFMVSVMTFTCLVLISLSS